MLDDFLVRALLAGVGIALVAGPLGCFVVWRRMAYFGDTMAHSGLLGVALGLLMGIDPSIGVLIVTLTVAVILTLLQRFKIVSTDTLLGILSHGALSVGLVAISFMAWLRVDLMAFLFGDILAVSKPDVIVVYIGGALILGLLMLIWRPLLAVTVDEAIARAEGLTAQRYQFLFTLMVAAVIAIAMKIVGVMLITSLLIIPAATARRFSKTPEQMAVIASILGALSVAIGLIGSYQFDTPSGPSVVVAALLLFVLGLLPVVGKKAI